MRFLCRILTPLLFAAAAAGCATSGGVATPEQIGERIEKQTGQKMRATPGPPEIPPGVITADGLTPEEAVAIALWNNPDFRAGLADLGIARADVDAGRTSAESGAVAALPVGPEAARMDRSMADRGIWQRPKRLKAAQTAAEAVAERVVVGGLALVADVRLAHADLAAAEGRVTLTSETAGLMHRISDIVRKRFEAGDISRARRGERRSRRAASRTGCRTSRARRHAGGGPSAPAARDR